MLGLEEVIGLEVISSDARVIGTVEGVGIDLAGWKVRALRVGLRRGMEEMIGRKRRYFAVDKVYIRTSELQAVSDAIIMHRPVSAIADVIQPEGETLTPAGAFMGMRVICCNARFVGNVDNLLMDPEKEWTIPFIQVKLERDAMEQLNMHHSFMGSSLINIRTSDIKAIGDMVIMSVTLDELKKDLSEKVQMAQHGAGGGARAEAKDDDHTEQKVLGQEIVR